MIKKVLVTQCICERCGYKWKPKSEEELPEICPECKSANWNKPKSKRKISSILILFIVISSSIGSSYGEESALTEGTNHVTQITYYCQIGVNCPPPYHPNAIQSFIDCMSDDWCQQRAMFGIVLGMTLFTFVIYLAYEPVLYLIDKIQSYIKKRKVKKELKDFICKTRHFGILKWAETK